MDHIDDVLLVLEDHIAAALVVGVDHTGVLVVGVDHVGVLVVGVDHIAAVLVVVGVYHVAAALVDCTAALVVGLLHTAGAQVVGGAGVFVVQMDRNACALVAGVYHTVGVLVLRVDHTIGVVPGIEVGHVAGVLETEVSYIASVQVDVYDDQADAYLADVLVIGYCIAAKKCFGNYH